MDDFGPRKLTIWVNLCVESKFEVQNAQLLHLNLKNRGNGTYRITETIPKNQYIPMNFLFPFWGGAQMNQMNPRASRPRKVSNTPSILDLKIGFYKRIHPYTGVTKVTGKPRRTPGKPWKN